MRQVELVYVSQNNNNKYYKMLENSDGTWTAKYGRVGYAEQVQSYPSGQWDKKYKEKLRKGYKDITSLRADEKTTDFIDISNSKINSFISTLYRYSKETVAKNYTISASNVTLVQVNEAQKIINDLVSATSVFKNNTDEINKLLIGLYTIIPRRMNNVKNYLLQNIYDQDWVRRRISDEQDLLDTMQQQVELHKVDKTESTTILDALGIKVEEIDDQEHALIKKLLGENSHQYLQAFKVLNLKTEVEYNKVSVNNESILWHGSRNPNWLNILKTGLLIKPAGIMTTGSMFGNGIYFANKARKSIGYTSLSGSYWARGNENKGYLALYSVRLGKQYVTQGSLNVRDVNHLKSQYGNVDSVYAKAGSSLYNDEFIIYTPQQCSIRYIVEIKN